MHIKISHILPIFCITGGKHNSDRQICKDITVNDAPAFWLQATAIKIPLSKSKDHQLCTFIHTHYAEKQPQVKCKNDLVFSCSPFQKRCPTCPIQNLWLPKDMKLQCRIFFMKEIAKHSKKHCNMFFFTAFCTPFPLYYLGNALDFLVTCAAPPLLVPFVRWLSRHFVTPQIMVTAKLSKSVSYSAQKINHFANQSNYVSFQLKCASCWQRRWRRWQQKKQQ